MDLTAALIVALVSVVAALALWVIPGAAVLAWLWPASARPLSPGQRLAAAIGVGIALPPIMLYSCDLIGLRWSAAATAVYVLAAIGALALARRRTTNPRAATLLHSDLLPVAAIALLAAGVQLYGAREVNAGMFGDSVHHTLIARLLLENGGLFDSWRPYAPLTTLTYHFGFHANVAFFSWATGVDVNRSVVVVGQLLNAATAPLMYVFVSRLFLGAHADQRRTAVRVGLWAAALAGFANLMPAWFINWGRYTQLTGHQVLLVLLAAWFELIELAALRAPRAALLRAAALAVLLLTALMLTHYIVLMFAAVAVAAYLLVAGARLGVNRRTGAALLACGGAAAAALLLAAPWVLNTLGAGLVRNTTLMATGAAGTQRQEAAAALIDIAPFYVRGWLLALGGVGVVFGALRRSGPAMFLFGWLLALFVLVTPRTFGLPGTGVVEQFTAYLAFYMVVTPLAAYAVVATLETATGLLPPRLRFTDGAAAAGVLAVCLYGAAWLPAVPDLQQRMLTPADERAMTWIRENTEADARFVVNTFPGYAGTVIAGTDAGWWVTQMTGRWTNLPPMTYGNENWEQPDFYRNTNAFAAALRGRPLTDPAAVAVDLTTPENLRRLQDAGITHVYLGANATPGPDVADHIDEAALRRSPAFELAYERDGVRIFRRTTPGSL